MLFAIKEQILNALVPVRKIGVFVSGGFDSGLLLYLIGDTIKQHNLQIETTIFVVPRFDDSVVHATRIAEWVGHDTNLKYNIVYIGDPTLHHSKQVESGIIELMDDLNGVEAIFTGATTNPPIELPGEAPLRGKPAKPIIQRPLLPYNKSDTVRAAIELNLTNLMILSHTCTQSKNLRCGKCWQCSERAWGFAQNNYTDPGAM
jgi:hypothetical protein